MLHDESSEGCDPVPESTSPPPDDPIGGAAALPAPGRERRTKPPKRGKSPKLAPGYRVYHVRLLRVPITDSQGRIVFRPDGKPVNPLKIAGGIPVTDVISELSFAESLARNDAIYPVRLSDPDADAVIVNDERGRTRFGVYLKAVG